MRPADDFQEGDKVWEGGEINVATWHGKLPTDSYRLIMPGEIIPKGAVTRFVNADMTLGPDEVTKYAWEKLAGSGPIVLVSLPEPEPCGTCGFVGTDMEWQKHDCRNETIRQLRERVRVMQTALERISKNDEAHYEFENEYTASGLSRIAREALQQAGTGEA